MTGWLIVWIVWTVCFIGLSIYFGIVYDTKNKKLNKIKKEGDPRGEKNVLKIETGKHLIGTILSSAAALFGVLSIWVLSERKKNKNVFDK